MIELHDFDYDTVKVEVDIAGSKKTIDLSDYGKLRVYYDVTSDVHMASNGHPIFASIDEIAQNYMNDLARATGTENHNV